MGWEFWIDRGGTFTDVVARTPKGRIVTHKLLSEDPKQYRDAAVAGIRHLMGLGRGAPIRPQDIACIRMGTTVATNALLERKGEPLVLVTTRGFRDALRIAYQDRPRLFDRHIVLPSMLYARVIEADERIGPEGTVERPLNALALRAQMQEAFDAGLRAVAIVFMHGWKYADHERRAAEIARAVGFMQVSVSHVVSPLIKFVARGDTTVADAYLSPILHRYIEQLLTELPGVRVLFMQSSGGLAEARAFGGKDALLSGPAGGIVGMARTAQEAGYTRAIGFDMGGTSTDVSHYAGTFEHTFEAQLAGVRVRVPMLSIHTVAAGGGSILHFDGQRMRVGPNSAGADPGPACYRRGGPLTITDAQVMLGRIRPEYFPAVFGPDSNEQLDIDVVRAMFTASAARIARVTGPGHSPESLAEGYVDIAVQAMAGAIKRISVARGYDVSRYTLQCFGGAAGQHACRVADALGIQQVFVHALAGVLSAYGMGLAEQTSMRQHSIERELDAQAMRAIGELLMRLSASARQELLEQGVASDWVRVSSRVHLRFAGTDTALPVPFAALEDMREAFVEQFHQQFAHTMPDHAVVVEAVSVQATGGRPQLEAPSAKPQEQVLAPVVEHVPVFMNGQWRSAALVLRGACRAGHVIEGPAIFVTEHTTLVVEPGWQAKVTYQGHVELSRTQQRKGASVEHLNADPMLLEVFNNQFMNIAEQMGSQLRNTAVSVNIKERLDYSCALFDAQGNLIANAPHIPVHLGSMGESVRTVIERNAGQLRPGDVMALNDPYHGGTHLPDITVVTPVFDRAGREILFFLGSRGHHADIGGLTPGSMPPFSRTIAEEGVALDNVKLVEGGLFREAEILRLLGGARHPARNPQQNLADLRAQIAANARGAQELRRLIADYGLPVVQAYMQHVQVNAEMAVRRVISSLRDGQFALHLDNGARIQVSIHVDHGARSAVIDFTGTAAQQANNFNAPRAVTIAAVLYVFRCLVDDDIPLNAGCLKPLTIVIPRGSMLDPLPPAAVVAGNVETSMCITNALFGALGVQAASQCTMNNFTFGNGAYQYYETIAGGSGAGGMLDFRGAVIDGFDGTDVVQTHMTNSRLTDPEVLELRYPVRLECFALRKGSGGSGKWNGGNGGVRRFRFLAPMTASILSNGRVVPAFGLCGGAAGALGVNRIERVNGAIEMLGPLASVEMQSGDVFVIETPGGGGFGERLE